MEYRPLDIQPLIGSCAVSLALLAWKKNHNAIDHHLRSADAYVYGANNILPPHRRKQRSQLKVQHGRLEDQFQRTAP